MSSSTQRLTLHATTGLGAGLLPIGLFAVFLATYSVYPNNYPHHDELYHVLAGASYAADGTLALGDSVYQRTPLFTMMIGQLFQTFGVSLPVARAPSIVASALWVATIYLCARPTTGRLAATLAAVGFGLSPVVVDVAKMARFYAFHGLFFTLGAFAIYGAIVAVSPVKQRLLGCVMGGAFLTIALNLQITTVIGALGLAAWAGGHLAIAHFGLGRKLALTVVGALAAAVVLFLITFELGVVAEALDTYRQTAPWAADRRDYEAFYLDLLLGYYPILLPLFPLAALQAFARAPKLTLFCSTLFGLAVVLHSLGGMKAERYITYLMPFFWIVLGAGLAPLVAPTLAGIGTLAARIGAMPALACLPRKLVGSGVRLTAGASLLGFAAMSLALPPSLEKLIHRLDAPIPNWRALPHAVGLNRETVFLTPNELHALHFIGDLHATLGPPPSPAGPSQTGRPAVTEADVLAALIACSPSGVIAADAWRWQNPGVVAEDVRRHAEAYLDAHPAGASLNLVVYTWTHEGPPDPTCPTPFERPLRLRIPPG